MHVLDQSGSPVELSGKPLYSDTWSTLNWTGQFVFGMSLGQD